MRDGALGERTYPGSAGDETGLISFCSCQEGKFGGVEESFAQASRERRRWQKDAVGGKISYGKLQPSMYRDAGQLFLDTGPRFRSRRKDAAVRQGM